MSFFSTGPGSMLHSMLHLDEMQEAMEMAENPELQATELADLSRPISSNSLAASDYDLCDDFSPTSDSTTTTSSLATDLPQTYHYNLNKPKWYTKQASSVTKGQKKQLSLHSPQFLVPTPAQFGTKLVFQSLYPTPGPLIFEIGFGLGANILSMARHNPSSNFLGAEIHRSSLSQCMATAAEMGCTNVKLYGGDAVKLLKNNMEDSALDQVIILFPDPWLTDGSMDKQHKGGNHDSASAVVPDASSAASSTASSADPAGDRRVVCPETIDIIYAKLKPEGLLHIATDADSYAIHVDTLMGDRKDFVGGIVDAPEWRRQAETKYEKRAKEELGHVVRDFCFVKQ